MSRIQEIFDSASENCVLEPEEYEGPLVIDRPCCLDGRGATLWVEKGPALAVKASPVTVKNLRVEVTEPGEDRDSQTALLALSAAPVLENVEVLGRLSGFGGKADGWLFPDCVCLGEFAPGKENSFILNLDAPETVSLEWDIKGLDIKPGTLQPGGNRLTVTAPPLRDNTVLYGNILARCGGLVRRIVLSGKAVHGTPQRERLPLGLSDGVIPLEPRPPAFLETSALPDWPASVALESQEAASFTAPEQEPERREARKGQRVPLPPGDRRVRITVDVQTEGTKIEVDAYVFRLYDTGKVKGDGDLFFFGNPGSAGEGVQISAEQNRQTVFLNLDVIEDAVQRIAVCLAPYSDKGEPDFSRIPPPEMRVLLGGREEYSLELADLGTAKTAAAVELYRHRQQWKVNFIAGGYRGDIRSLCEDYGLEVL